jgi:hypothetical protein
MPMFPLGSPPVRPTPDNSRNRHLTRHRSLDATHARRVLSYGDEIDRLDSVGKRRKKPGALLPAHRTALLPPPSQALWGASSSTAPEASLVSQFPTTASIRV